MTGTLTNPDQPRVAAAEEFELLDLPHDKALDDLARLAAQMCNAPLCLIAVASGDLLRIVGSAGMDSRTLMRGGVPYDVTVSGEGVYQIPDARLDPDYAPGGIFIDEQRQRTLVRVDHDDDTGPLLQTSVSGSMEPLTRASLRRALWRYPAMSFGVIARIHWQAARLWIKRVPFLSKPETPAHFVTR